MMGVTGDWGVRERERWSINTLPSSESIKASRSLTSTPSLMSVCLNMKGQGSLLWLVGRPILASCIFLSHSLCRHSKLPANLPSTYMPFRIKVVYFWYFRTHLASTCTKQIEINHRYRHSSKPWGLDAQMLHVVPGEGASWCHSHCMGWICLQCLLQDKCWRLFSVFTFSPQKWKSSLGFFQLTEVDANIGLL